MKYSYIETLRIKRFHDTFRVLRKSYVRVVIALGYAMLSLQNAVCTKLKYIHPRKYTHDR